MTSIYVQRAHGSIGMLPGMHETTIFLEILQPVNIQSQIDPVLTHTSYQLVCTQVYFDTWTDLISLKLGSVKHPDARSGLMVSLVSPVTHQLECTRIHSLHTVMLSTAIAETLRAWYDLC